MRQKIQVKYLFAILVLALSATTQAETPVVEWIRQVGTSNNDYGEGVSVDGSGNVYVTGYTEGSLDGNTSAGYSDMFLTKYSTDGTKLWTEQLGSANNDYSYGVSVDGSGNAYVTGCTAGSLDGNASMGYRDVFLTKYNTNGTKLWTEQLGSANYDWSYGVSVDSSGNAYITGCTLGSLDDNTNAGYEDIFLTKYATDGTKLWTEQLGSARWDVGYDMSVDGSGNVYVTGFTNGSLDDNTNAGVDDMFLAKYATDGTKLWTEQLGSNRNDYGLGVSVDGSGNIYVAGETAGSLDGNVSAGGYDMFLTKYATDGTRLWTEQLGSANNDYGLDVSVDGSGNVYVTGKTEGSLDGNPNAGVHDMFLAKYAMDGTKLWTEQLGTNGDDRGYGVSVDSSGNVFVGGYTEGSLDGNPNAGGSDMFLVKITTEIPGDANRDGRVDGSDVTILAANWQFGVSDDQVANWAMGDFNADGQVDGSDVTILAANWQEGVTASTASVPEPGSFVMLAGIAFMAMWCRKRKHV